jgi:hypothetical protein
VIEKRARLNFLRLLCVRSLPGLKVGNHAGPALVAHSSQASQQGYKCTSGWNRQQALSGEHSKEVRSGAIGNKVILRNEANKSFIINGTTIPVASIASGELRRGRTPTLSDRESLQEYR